ncbi:hypothetical protein [Streptomyces goshikiensis]|uniref:hypothetical protein n=1 Tax=Streptomyces goshikiensis TaxID=1942 RepID=UPI003648C46A
MARDISYERDALEEVAQALRDGDRERAHRVLRRLAAEGDPAVVAEIARQTAPHAQ